MPVLRPPPPPDVFPARPRPGLCHHHLLQLKSARLSLPSRPPPQADLRPVLGFSTRTSIFTMNTNLDRLVVTARITETHPPSMRDARHGHRRGNATGAFADPSQQPEGIGCGLVLPGPPSWMEPLPGSSSRCDTRPEPGWMGHTPGGSSDLGHRPVTQSLGACFFPLYNEGAGLGLPKVTYIVRAPKGRLRQKGI